MIDTEVEIYYSKKFENFEEVLFGTGYLFETKILCNVFDIETETRHIMIKSIIGGYHNINRLLEVERNLIEKLKMRIAG
jgi:hypothetical protein